MSPMVAVLVRVPCVETPGLARPPQTRKTRKQGQKSDLPEVALRASDATSPPPPPRPSPPRGRLPGAPCGPIPARDPPLTPILKCSPVGVRPSVEPDSARAQARESAKRNQKSDELPEIEFRAFDATKAPPTSAPSESIPRLRRLEF